MPPRVTSPHMTRTLACVVGARPNFVKMGPILAALKELSSGLQPLLVHTGQHYDTLMSDLFFAQLGLPAPAAHLEALRSPGRANRKSPLPLRVLAPKNLPSPGGLPGRRGRELHHGCRPCLGETRHSRDPRRGRLA
ncbi:hypothetical protein SBV1_810064 [Verrucomicrobia bacterium]|nr:hypothetical protein SBV1_810064 [Verrucomicrobiota bacterium]